MSKMSGSCWSSLAGRPHPSHACGPSGSDDTVTCPSGQYQAGIRCPHQSCRDTFQSRMLVIQCSHVFSKRAGRIRVLPSRVAASAFAASGSVRMNHCVFRRGSITSLLRWQRPMTISWGFSPSRSPEARSCSTIRSRAAYRSRPVKGAPASLIVASSLRTVIIGSPCRLAVA